MTDRVVEIDEADEPEVIELDEEASDIEKAQAAVEGVVGPGSLDPLAALLDWDTSKPIQDRWYSRRLKAWFTYEAFHDDRDYERVVERATRYVKRRGGGRQREIDNRQLSKLVVIERVVDPVFSPQHGQAKFQRLAAKYGSEDPEVLVGRALLPGEIDQLAEKILELSGYDDDLEEAAGN